MENFYVYLAILIALLFWIFNRFASSQDNLEALGIPNEKGLPVFGNGLAIVFTKEPVIHFFERLYERFPNEKIFGFTAFFGKYTIVLKDPVMIKQVAVKDFEFFLNRDPIEHAEADKYLSKSILLSRDQKWKDMRATLSPVYTSSKIKHMYSLLTDTITDFVKFYEEKAVKSGGEIIVETHNIFARVTADGIATTTFGFQGDCVRNQASEIFKVAYDLEGDFTNQQTFILQTFPWFYKLLGKQICRKSVHEFFEVNILSEIQRRQKQNITRPDVIQLLLQAKEGKLKVEKSDEDELSYMGTKVQKISQWTDDDLVAQAVIFFLGGFETTAVLMQAMSYELTLNPNVQQTLTDEVDEMLGSLNGKIISYDQLNGMKFLEMVVNETLRKWPSFRITSRECTKDYILKDEDSGKSYQIKKGTEIFLPIGALHNDPKFFPEPHKFDPYRFSDENKGNIEAGSFIPFGYGPRMCIGSRFAILEAKMLIFHIMTKFSFAKCAETPEKLFLAPGLTGFRDKIHLTMKLRNKAN